jgi:hypothetical protein
VGPDEDPGAAQVARDDVARLVDLGRIPEDLRESVADESADGLVPGRAVDPGDGDPLDVGPKGIRGDGLEGSPDGGRHGPRVGRGGDKSHAATLGDSGDARPGATVVLTQAAGRWRSRLAAPPDRVYQRVAPLQWIVHVAAPCQAPMTATPESLDRQDGDDLHPGDDGSGLVVFHPASSRTTEFRGLLPNLASAIGFGDGIE